MNSQAKTCQNCKKEFVIEPEDFLFYEKIKVPPPTWCPECRMARKFSFRNERTLYKRNCELCGRSIITVYHPQYLAPIYCFSCHQSDKWDPFFYALTYNSRIPFFEQFLKLLLRVPKAALHIGITSSPNVNSDYVNFAGGARNCYLIFNSAENDNCGYSRGLIKCRDSFDMYFAEQHELCYEGINVNKSNGVMWGQNVLDSLSSYFLLNCADVQNCFGCVNLRHKAYHFFNLPLAKGEWMERVNNILGSHRRTQEAREMFQEFSLKFPRKENNNLKSTNCVGDYLFESKNCFSCFEAFGCEDCKYGFSTKLTKDSYDIIGRGVGSELLLENVAVGSNCSRVIGSWSVEASQNVEYSYDLRACEHCFGCVGLRHAQYCILNKQYSAEEYTKIRAQIVEELKSKNLYGLYFPLSISPWAYNETIAQEYFPLTKEQAIEQGFSWKPPEERNYQVTIKAEDLPDHIKDVPDTMTKEVIGCSHRGKCNEQCTEAFRIIEPELQFYRRMNLPLPRLCPNCRHYQRLKQRNPLKLWQRQCQCGGQTSVSQGKGRPSPDLSEYLPARTRR